MSSKQAVEKNVWRENCPERTSDTRKLRKPTNHKDTNTSSLSPSSNSRLANACVLCSQSINLLICKAPFKQSSHRPQLRVSKIKNRCFKA